jgi:hypothetical protein
MNEWRSGWIRRWLCCTILSFAINKFKSGRDRGVARVDSQRKGKLSSLSHLHPSIPVLTKIIMSVSPNLPKAEVKTTNVPATTTKTDQPQEDTSKMIFVGNLSYQTRESELQALCEKIGKV